MAHRRDVTVLCRLASRQTSAAHVLTTKLWRFPMSLRRVLFGITLLSISLLTTAVSTHARDRLQSERSQGIWSGSNSLTGKRLGRRPAAQRGSRVPGFSMSKRELDKFIKSAVKRCGCASAAQDTEYSNSCFKSCVARYVGWSTVLACGMACTGNAAACAVCVGVHEWVVLGCLQYCVWRDVLSYVEDGVSSNQGRPSTKRPGKPLMRSPGGAASTRLVT